MHVHPNPKFVFAAVSLLLITVIGISSSISQAVSFRGAIVDREARIIDDVVDALAMGTQDRPVDLARYRDPDVQAELSRRFDALTRLPGFAQAKVFNAQVRVAWSDAPALIGTAATNHPADVRRALHGEVRAIFDPIQQVIYSVTHRGPEPLIEFYVPFSWAGPVKPGDSADGVVALYRSPRELNGTLLNGLLLLWLVTLAGGTILFVAIYLLYRSLYERHQQAQLTLATITQDQERIIQLEKLSAMGQMVTEIAHQLNNPLVGVVNLAELAEREIDDPERVRELLHSVQQAGRHCRDFVQRMLRLNASARSEPRLADVADLARETVTLFRQSCRQPPQIELELPPEPVLIELDPVLIRHVLFNLLSNAAQADPAGCTTVRVAAQPGADDVQGCAVEISDSGPGFSAEVAAKLFTPFFTTRRGGTGLGLLVAQHIVVRHRGKITARNRPQGGASFLIWLPARPQDVNRPRAQQRHRWLTARR